MESFWKWHVIPENLWFFAKAFGLTLELFALSFIGCWVVAVILGTMRYSDLWWLRHPAAAVIEVMKMFTGVSAPCRGRVVEILVEDAAMVEYGQPLMSIEPA